MHKINHVAKRVIMNSAKQYAKFNDIEFNDHHENMVKNVIEETVIQIQLQITEKKEYFDLAEKQALTIPVVIWRFCAYKSEEDYELGEHYFKKDFLDHTEMKKFSAKHSAKEMLLHPNYCSMYWKINNN